MRDFHDNGSTADATAGAIDMAGRAPQGSVRARQLADGSRMFELRFLANGKRESVVLHERPDCECGCGGGWDERAARRELSNVMARVRVGVWEPDKARSREASKKPETVPTFHEYASQWLDRRSDGVLGDRPLSANTRSDYLWRLRGHLLPFFGTRRLDEIDAEMCLAFKAQKRRESRDLRASMAAGTDIRDERNRRRVPLGPPSIRNSSPVWPGSWTTRSRTVTSSATRPVPSACASASPSRSAASSSSMSSAR
jgi:hypothetical protein